MGAQSSDALYRGLMTHWRDPEAIAGAAEPPTVLTSAATQPSFSSVVNRMRYFDMVSELPDDILVKVDRAAMAVSLESRAPFLHQDVVEFAWRIPLSQQLRDGQGKWLLRQVLYRYVPKALIERPKMGFGVPIDQWLRGPLKEWAETLLSRQRLESDGYLAPAMVRTAWDEHQSREVRTIRTCFGAHSCSVPGSRPTERAESAIGRAPLAAPCDLPTFRPMAKKTSKLPGFLQEPPMWPVIIVTIVFVVGIYIWSRNAPG